MGVARAACFEELAGYLPAPVPCTTQRSCPRHHKVSCRFPCAVSASGRCKVLQAAPSDDCSTSPCDDRCVIFAPELVTVVAIILGFVCFTVPLCRFGAETRHSGADLSTYCTTDTPPEYGRHIGNLFQCQQRHNSN